MGCCQLLTTLVRELPAGNNNSQVASNPAPTGYSLSMFNPPGLPFDKLGIKVL